MRLLPPSPNNLAALKEYAASVSPKARDFQSTLKVALRYSWAACGFFVMMNLVSIFWPVGVMKLILMGVLLLLAFFVYLYSSRLFGLLSLFDNGKSLKEVIMEREAAAPADQEAKNARVKEVWLLPPHPHQLAELKGYEQDVLTDAKDFQSIRNAVSGFACFMPSVIVSPGLLTSTELLGIWFWPLLAVFFLFALFSILYSYRSCCLLALFDNGKTLQEVIAERS